MVASDFTLLNWNVRGLNAPVKRNATCDMAKAVHASVVCIQETKLNQLDLRLVSEMLGHKFNSNFSFLSAIGTCGGILIAASEDHFKLIASHHTQSYTLTVIIQILNDATECALTGVYELFLIISLPTLGFSIIYFNVEASLIYLWNLLSDAPYRNSGMVLNGQGPGRHPLGDASYLDLDTVLNE
jgi:hypothetical protein